MLTMCRRTENIYDIIVFIFHTILFFSHSFVRLVVLSCQLASSLASRLGWHAWTGFDIVVDCYLVCESSMLLSCLLILLCTVGFFFLAFTVVLHCEYITVSVCAALCDYWVSMCALLLSCSAVKWFEVVAVEHSFKNRTLKMNVARQQNKWILCKVALLVSLCVHCS